MSINTSKHDIRIAVPSTVDNAQAVEAWLVAMSDASWRVITDFRNWPHWIPQMDSVEQEDSGPPARGTRLIIEREGAISVCTIDRWDPPRSLQNSMGLGAGEIAYGFLIETGLKQRQTRAFPGIGTQPPGPVAPRSVYLQMETAATRGKDSRESSAENQGSD